jgi:hypothetical protein
MATTIRELLVALGVDADTAAVSEFDSAIGDAKSSMATAAQAAAVLAGGIALVAGSIAAVVNAVAVSGDEAAKASKRVGVTTAEFQELSFAADRSGASIQDVETSLRRLAVGTDELATTGGTAADALTRLFGDEDSAKEASSLGQLGFLEAIAEEMKGLEDETTKMALANDIFGKGGAKLLPLLNEGGDALRAYRQEAHDLGLVLSVEGAAASEEFVDGLTNAKAFLVGLRNTIGEGLLPVFNDMLGRFSDWAKANGDIIRQRMEKWAKKIEGGIIAIRDALVALEERIDVIATVGFLFEAAAVAAAALATALSAVVAYKTTSAILSMIKAFKSLAAIVGVSGAALGGWVAAVAAVIGVIVLLALAYQDLVVLWQGGSSAIGEFIEKHEGAAGIMGALVREGQATLEMLQAMIDLLDAVVIAFDGAWSAAQEFLSAFGVVLPEVGELIERYLTSELDRLTGMIGAVTDAIQGLTGFVSGGTYEPSVAPMSGASTAISNAAVSNQVSVTVNGQADADDIARQIEDALARSNRDAVAALAGAEV